MSDYSYSTLNTTPTGDEDDSLGAMSEMEATLVDVLDKLDYYGMPCIVCLGLLGNAAVVAVYACSARLRHQPCSLYLGFMAAVDSGFLLCVSMVWLQLRQDIDLFYANGWCQTVIYFSYVFNSLSVWTVVTFTLERFVVVFWPVKGRLLSTKKHALCMIVCLSAFSLLFYSFSLFTSRVEEGIGVLVCSSNHEDHEDIIKIFTSIDTFTIIFLPSACILTLNSCIAVRLRQYSRTALSLDVTRLPSQFGSCRGDYETVPGTRQWRFLTRRRQTQLRSTRSVCLVSFIFLLLNLPSYPSRINIFVYNIHPARPISSMSVFFLWEILNWLSRAHFAVNFLLYSACSSSFRSALKRMICRGRHHNPVKKTAV